MPERRPRAVRPARCRPSAALLVVAIALAACGDAGGRAPDPRPEALVGRWVRLRADSTWGDTMTFRADGALLGSTGYVVPTGLRWRVNPDTLGGPHFCARASADYGFCRPYELRDGSLVLLGGGPNGPTHFRRVP